MKKVQFYIKTIILLLSFCFHTSFGQMKQKDAYVVYINYPDYTIKTTVSNSTKKISVKESLTYYWYSSNKIMQTKGDYDGKIVDGPYTSFYLSNSLKEKGNFKKGLKNGKWISWYENGKINEITNWNAGLKSGEYKKFNADESLSLTAYYKKDKLNGTQTIYNNGVVDSRRKYKHGKEIIKNKKNNAPADTLAPSPIATLQKKSWKEKIKAPFKRKKKNDTNVTSQPVPAAPQKTGKERLKALFKKNEKKPKTTEAIIEKEKSQDTPPKAEKSPKQKKTKDNPQETAK